jgi:hypothetical protein
MYETRCSWLWFRRRRRKVAQALQYRRRQDSVRNETTQPSQASDTNNLMQVAEADALAIDGQGASPQDPSAHLSPVNVVAASAPPAAIGSSTIQEGDESKQGEHLERDADYLSLLEALSRGAHLGHKHGPS